MSIELTLHEYRGMYYFAKDNDSFEVLSKEKIFVLGSLLLENDPLTDFKNTREAIQFLHSNYSKVKRLNKGQVQKFLCSE